MKKERSVTGRNFLGSFLGGFIGILTFGYLHAALLPLGVLGGVLIGWWYEDIIQAVIEACRQGLEQGQQCYRFLSEIAINPRQKLWKIKERTSGVGKAISLVCAGTIVVFIWILASPIRFVNWYRTHPMNRACLIRFTSLLTYIGINYLWVFMLVMEFNRFMGGTINPQGKVMPFEVVPIGVNLFLAGILVMFAIIPGIRRIIDDPDGSMRNFYRDFEYYSRRGPVIFFINDLVNAFIAQLKAFTFIAVGLIYFTGLGAIFVVIIVIPLSVFIWSIKKIQQIAIRTDYWLCLAATMIITILSAWQFYSYFTNEYALWSIAFMTGFASGIATEGIRRGILWILTETSKGRQYADAEIGAYLRDRLALGDKFVLYGWRKMNLAEFAFSYLDN
jgi:hypothetical protein